MKISDLKIVMSILGVVIVILFLMYGGGYLGIDAEVANDMWGVLPGITGIGVGLMILTTRRLGTFSVAGFGVIGIGLVVLLGEMNTHEIIVDEYITAGWTLVEIQSLFIVICVLVGFVMAAVSRARY